MLQLIKQIVSLGIRNRWLKAIEKERRKYERLCAQANRQAYIVRRLIDRYNELYKEAQL